MKTLTAFQILTLTAPSGMSASNWNDYLTSAYLAGSWADPWEEGFDGWQAFVDSDEPVAKDVESIAVAVDRTTFRRLVAQHVPKGRPGSVSAQALAFAVADHAHEDGSQCFPSAEILAAKLGNSRPRVSEARTKLIADGWLTATGQTRGRAIVYQLSVPAHLMTGRSEVAEAA